MGKIKNNKIVFESLLQKSDKIKTKTNELGIVLKNKEAKHWVVKVCNPYCGPCSHAHPVLEELYDRGIIDLQLVFSAKADSSNSLAKPVSHFLAIDENYPNNKGVIKKALDDWYNTKKKDYEVFSKKYPMNGELDNHWDKIKLMEDWCKEESITHTPTIFVNGYKLPKEYNIDDLREILA